jgi:hypothetical protein
MSKVIGGPRSCQDCEHTNDFFYGVMDVDVVLTEPVKWPRACGLSSCSTAVHWPVSQGTYLRQMNLTVGGGLTGAPAVSRLCAVHLGCDLPMPRLFLSRNNISSGNAAAGIFGEAGSGGLISDVAISGGDYGACER